ncbi:MAG: hypothetical protein R3C24_08535 [Cyanobacteriota/Melainabacteria group bacterium]|nr:hypothetical protein [Cyanobacteria bacterium HKST-UBA01]MCB9471546.1 hypothetical protein [Candidatus Obscuribacterales bacterium]
MASSGGANRIELESQILCSALRLSWAESDVSGMVKSCQELYQLFPDLLPPPKADSDVYADNYYELLQIECDVNPSMVLAAYFKSIKRFLRKHADPKEDKEKYFKILNAGFILRKPRLRLSHDLIVARSSLVEQRIIPDDGTLEMIEAPDEPIPETQPIQMVTTQQIDDSLPKLIELMKNAQFTGPAEVQALLNQMKLYPDIPLIDLVLQAGYVTEPELKSLQLAEYLLSQNKITMGQFCVAMYDERTTGIRMAESLQVRGWLDTEAPRYDK